MSKQFVNVTSEGPNAEEANVHNRRFSEGTQALQVENAQNMLEVV